MSATTRIVFLTVLIVVIVACGFRVTDGIRAGNAEPAQAPSSPDPEFAFGRQFAQFYPYTLEQRGMVPMVMSGKDGVQSTLADYKGRVVLLHFWATWCPPCIKELPVLAELNRKKGGGGFVILPVSLDYGLDHQTLVKFMAKYGVKGLDPLMVPPKDPSWDTLTGFALPTSFLIGVDGRVLYKMVGDINWASPITLDFIDHLLANQE